MKYRVIYLHREEYPVSDMCQFFEVSRSGYYDFICPYYTARAHVHQQPPFLWRGPKDVQELLGCSDVNTTMNIYVHATREAKRSSARLLDKAASSS